ncbi:hypothetical protein GCM10007420_09750 [Glycocaulis albus]|uniref:Uncharacterized protein n=1 Tax=Glycocaulis albus TaxID=1382801 RepID=A0ABQ1XKJ3_9PROT|nr:hypothetical protein GCM10007420_09750 [Glycocaulis albus]
MHSDRERFRGWLNAANQCLLRDYLIDFHDAGLESDDLERYFAAFEMPHEFVQFYAYKYDLHWFDEYTGTVGPMRRIL